MIVIEFHAPMGMDTKTEWTLSVDGHLVASGCTSEDAQEILERHLPEASPDAEVEVIHLLTCEHEARQVSHTTVRELMQD